MEASLVGVATDAQVTALGEALAGLGTGPPEKLRELVVCKSAPSGDGSAAKTEVYLTRDGAVWCAPSLLLRKGRLPCH
jgi:hypothetical protein